MHNPAQSTLGIPFGSAVIVLTAILLASCSGEGVAQCSPISESAALSIGKAVASREPYFFRKHGYEDPTAVAAELETEPCCEVSDRDVSAVGPYFKGDKWGVMVRLKKSPRTPILVTMDRCGNVIRTEFE